MTTVRSGAARSPGTRPSTPTPRSDGGRAAPAGPVGALAAGAFGLVSALRGHARSLHPTGLGYAATFRVRRPVRDLRGVALFSGPAEHEAICRFSRGGGLPEPLPDVLGLAVRIPDLYGPGRHQDFLLATGASARLARHLLLPGIRGFFGQTLTSLLPYDMGGSVRMVGASSPHARIANAGGTLAELNRAAAEGGLCFDLMLAPLAGDWHLAAEIDVLERLPDHEVEQLAFTPGNTGGGLRPVGPFQGLRRPAYRGSQRGRGLRPEEIP
jgi:hypothetical protein